MDKFENTFDAVLSIDPSPIDTEFLEEPEKVLMCE